MPAALRGPRRRLHAGPILLCFVVACGNSGDSPAGPPPPPAVATVAVSAPAATLTVGATMTLTATALSASGTALSGRAIAWSTSDGAIVTVASDGKVTGVAPGTATLTAMAEGKSASVTVIVTAPPVPAVTDVAVVDAVWTQGVQKPDGAFPLVLGTPAALNVLLRAVGASTLGGVALPGQLVLVLTDASGGGAVVRADTIVPRWPGTAPNGIAPNGGAPTLAAPSAQFLVPASALRAGLRWRVVRDPKGAAKDDSAANDVFPRAGDVALRVVDLPTLRIRFVPITLAAHGGVTGAVSTLTLEDYLQTVRSTFPVGRIDAAALPAVTSGASFGTAPNGGASPFWIQVLQDLDLAHVASGDADTYWYGVVRPPAGFNFTSFGGWGYIPTTPTAVGPATRTALGVQTNWFTRPTQARDLVAHELAHNHGRHHAPCGGPDGLDPAFPFANGSIGQDGVAHDVFSWAAGRASGAPAVGAATGDVMSYCFPLWASTYTYEALLAARTAQASVASVAPATVAPARVLVVQGQIDGGRITLRPAVTITAPTPASASLGTYRVEGRDASGALLFARAFTPSALDHADVELFTVAEPVTDDVESRLVELRVTGPGGRAARLRTAARPPRAPAVRHSAGAIEATCGDPAAQAIVLADAATGAVLASTRGAAITVAGAAAGAVRVSCSDGVRTTSRVVR